MGRANLAQTTAAQALVLLGFSTVAVVGLLWAYKSSKADSAERREFLEKHPISDDESLTETLGMTWKNPDRPPKTSDVQKVLGRASRDGANRACIVYFGEADVPECAQTHFEPVIVTPTSAMGKRLLWLVPAGALIVLWLLDYLDLWPRGIPSIRRFMGSFLLILTAGFITLVIWFWRATVRPTYLRMAPGIMQALEYRHGRSKPIARSYPMEQGTLVVVTRERNWLTLALAREQMTDIFRLHSLRDLKTVGVRLWQALLSTAPTPPLSDEELVG
ncbi:MAG TPA: hypothetical protein VM487_25310 [Phycisphaerae bacterium]|nr:hypothetical protein [Phycisphaerae bacterium]